MRKLGLLLLVAFLTMVLVPAVARAGHLSCGDTVTGAVTLDGDLNCTTTPGLTIGADGTTLNLNGFTLTGAACGGCHGIQIFGFADVTIGNGTVVGFEQGIRGEEVSRLTLKHLTVRDQTSSSAIDIVHGERVLIEHVRIDISVVSDPIEAIRLENVDGAIVKNVRVDGGSIGINFGCAPCNTGERTNGVIMDSTFANNGNGILLASTTDAAVFGNTVTGSAGSSILVGLSFLNGVFGFPADAFPSITGVKLGNNTVSGGGGNGILMVATSGSSVGHNRITGNAGRGIWLINGISLLGSTMSDDSTGNNLFGNTATGNGGFDMAHDGGSTPNTWTFNTCGTSSGADIDCP